MNRRTYFENVLFNGIEARVKNLIESIIFPLLEYQKEGFIFDSIEGINQVIYAAIINSGYSTPLTLLEIESEYIERHSNRLVEYMSNLDANKYTNELSNLIRSIAKDISNLINYE